MKKTIVMNARPITFREASKFIIDNHRHHPPMQGWKFGIGLVDESNQLLGVIVAGRPVARSYDNGYTLEVTRCCTDGTKDAISNLYGRVYRIAKAMGYKRLITYTLCSETGSSMLACGFTQHHIVKGTPWNNKSRKRKDEHPLEDKVCWEINIKQ